MAIASINPASGETLRTFDSLSGPQIDAKIQRAAETFRRYRRTAFAERAPADSTLRCAIQAGTATFWGGVAA